MAVIQLFFPKFWFNIKINSPVDSKMKNMALLYYKQAYSFTIAEELETGREKKRRVKGAQLLYGRGHMNYQLAIRTSSLATPEQLAMATGPTALVVLGQ